MATTETRKVLGQEAPSATTETDLYEVPAGKDATITGVLVANRGTASTTYRISISVGGGATANKDYTHYDVAIPGNDTYQGPPDMLAAGDIVRVYAGNGNLSFKVSGIERTL